MPNTIAAPSRCCCSKPLLLLIGNSAANEHLK
jgi:hypothetical protein